MKLAIAAEYNENGQLLWLCDYPGIALRGRTREEALGKLGRELDSYRKWTGSALTGEPEGQLVQEKYSSLQICDADSDILLDTERLPLTMAEYSRMKALALRSAADFLRLYCSIPNKDGTTLPERETFYGKVPRTAEEMYQHTKNVNNYYFGELGLEVSNEPDILLCRQEGFDILEQQPDFLQNKVFSGSYGEEWSLRKVCRRFVWHDRIHARAMYKMATALCGREIPENPFGF